MDFKEILRIGLDECLDGLCKALDGLTAAEWRFQPNAVANHIDFIVWHMARDEDGEIHTVAQRTSELWQREAWDQKLRLPAGDNGFGYTVEQVATLPRFDMVDCLAYYKAVRRATRRYLDGLTPADLERCPHPERRPGSTIGSMLSHLIVEGSQHLGQVAYLRGLQHGLEYPTSWVSARTPWPDSRPQHGR
jgi:DinB family protein